MHWKIQYNKRPWTYVGDLFKNKTATVLTTKEALNCPSSPSKNKQTQKSPQTKFKIHRNKVKIKSMKYISCMGVGCSTENLIYEGIQARFICFMDGSKYV